MYGFAANKELLAHYTKTFGGEFIGVFHPFQFAIDANAARIMEVYDYGWTDEEISKVSDLSEKEKLSFVKK